MIADLQNWISAKWRQLTRPLKAPSIRVENETIIYEGEDFLYRLPVAEIIKIDAYERDQGLSPEWGVIYTGKHKHIVVSEKVDGFNSAFDRVADHLGFDGVTARYEATKNAKTDPAVVNHYPVYNRPSDD